MGIGEEQQVNSGVKGLNLINGGIQMLCCHVLQVQAAAACGQRESGVTTLEGYPESTCGAGVRQ